MVVGVICLLYFFSSSLQPVSISMVIVTHEMCIWDALFFLLLSFVVDILIVGYRCSAIYQKMGKLICILLFTG